MRKDERDILDEFLYDLQLNSEDELETEKEEIMNEIYEKLGLNKKKKVAESWTDKAEALTIIQYLFGEMSPKERVRLERELQLSFDPLWKKTEEKLLCYLYVNEFDEEETILSIPEVNILYRVYKQFLKAKFFFSKVAYYIAFNQLFEIATLSVILINSIYLGIDDLNSVTQTDMDIDIFFNVFYCTEAALKIFALGFIFGKKAYLSDPWNVLDFIIVITSILPYVITVNVSLKPLRTFRVLRPLRTVTKIKQLRQIIATLYQSKKLIIDSIVIVLLFIVVFGVIGNNFFMGIMKQRCIHLASGMVGSFCGGGLSPACAQGAVCGRAIGNLLDVVNYDTFPWAMLMVYQGITMEGWSDIMCKTMRASNYFVVLYSIPLILVGSYLLTNLTIAIINFKFHEVHHHTADAVVETEVDRWEVRRMKELVSNSVNLYYDRISNLKFRGLITEKSVLINGINYMIGTTWEKRLPKVLRSSSRVLSKNLIKTVRIEDRNPLSDPKPEDLALKRVTRVKQTSLMKLNYYGEDSEDLLKKLHFEPIILKPFSKPEPEPIEEEDGSEDSINTEELLQNKRKEGPQAREMRYRKRKMMEMKRFIADLKLKSNAVEQPKSELAEEAAKFDFSKINPETLQKNYEELFSDMVLENYIHGPRKKKEERDEPFRFQQKELKDLPAENEDATKALVAEFDKSMDLLREANELATKNLKLRIKPIEELEGLIQFSYSGLLLNRETKRLASKEEEMRARRVEKSEYVLNYESTETAAIERLVQNYELRLPDISETEERERKEEAEEPEIVMSSRQKVREVKQERAEADYLSQRGRGNSAEKQSFRMKKFKVQDEVRRKNKFFKDPEVLNIFVEEGKRTAEEEETALVSDLYLQRRKGEINPSVQCVAEVITEEVLEVVPSHLPNSLNVIPERLLVFMIGCLGIVVYLRARLKLFMFSPFVDNLMLLFVLCNTVVLALNGLIDSNNSTLSLLNIFFTFAFTVDCTLKILAIGFDYFRELMNNFDVIVVVLSLYDLGVNGFTATTSKYTAFRSIRIFRAFRVFRITRFIRQLKYMQVIMSVVNATIADFIYILLLLLIFLYIYTLLGRQLFNGLIFPTVYPRQNFNSLQDSFFTMFHVMTTSNWNDAWTNIYAMNFGGSGYVAALYVISWIFLGNYCLLNLFLAILLDGFGGGDNDELQQEVKEIGEDIVVSAVLPSSDPLFRESSAQHAHKTESRKPSRVTGSTKVKRGDKPGRKTQIRSKCEMAYFLFDRANPVRVLCQRLLDWKYNELIWQAAIVVSTAKLIYDTYLDAGSPQSTVQASLQVNIVITVFFLWETAVKSIAQGLLLDEGSYLSDNWAKMDFLIVIFSILDISISSVDLSFVKIMRSLRPLRFISNSVSMRIIFTALIESVSGILNVGLLMFLVLLMFTILMVNLLSGNLYYCNANSYGLFSIYSFNQQECTANFLSGASWAIFPQNFENVGRGMLSLYVLMAKEDFPAYFYQWVDSNPIQPVANNSFLVYLLISFIFIFICAYFLINLTIGVVFLNYHIAEEKLKPRELTEAQECWVALQTLIAESKPAMYHHIVPEHPLQRLIFRLVKSFYFEQLMNLLIVCNMVELAIEYDDEPLSYGSMVKYFSMVINFSFILETLLKLVAFGLNFFKMPWNVFDLVTNIVYFIDFIDFVLPQNLTNGALETLPSIFRILRMMRLYRIVNNADSLRGVKRLFQTIYYAIPAMLNALALLFLTQSIYAILGAFIFGNIQFNLSDNPDILNFKNFHSAWVSIFVWTSGENWYLCAYDMINSAGYGAALYWLSFQTIVPQVLVQLFVLVMLDEFENNFIRSSNPYSLFDSIEQDFIEQWVIMSEKREGLRIEERKVIDLYLALRLPLGFNFETSLLELEEQLQRSGADKDKIKMQIYESKLRMKKEASREIIEMKLISEEGFLSYNNLFYEIAKRRFNPLEPMNDLQATVMAEAASKAERLLEMVKSENKNEVQLRRKEVNPLVRMLFSQMVITTWARYSQKKVKLRDDESVDEIEPLYLKVSNNRREDRARSKLLPKLALDLGRVAELPDTSLYAEADEDFELA